MREEAISSEMRSIENAVLDKLNSLPPAERAEMVKRLADEPPQAFRVIGPQG